MSSVDFCPASPLGRVGELWGASPRDLRAGLGRCHRSPAAVGKEASDVVPAEVKRTSFGETNSGCGACSSRVLHGANRVDTPIGALGARENTKLVIESLTGHFLLLVRSTTCAGGVPCSSSRVSVKFFRGWRSLRGRVGAAGKMVLLPVPGAFVGVRPLPRRVSPGWSVGSRTRRRGASRRARRSGVWRGR